MQQHVIVERAPGPTPRELLAAVRRHVAAIRPSSWLFILGALALIGPTMAGIARFSWSTEQGGHGPLVLATGLWLLARERQAIEELRQPGSAWVILSLMPVFLGLYIFARITGIIEIEGFAMYGALLLAAYALLGGRVLRHLWFPLLYLALVFPPPDSLVAAITQPIKIWISASAVELLHFLGYPIASTGVTIQIAQYELLVAAACAGLNSIISLAAICLFYIYIRHNANYRYAALLLLAIVPVAIFANFGRVLILILLTYHFGEAAAQGFMHNFAGLSMFTLSLVAIFAVDKLASPLRRYLAGRSAHA